MGGDKFRDEYSLAFDGSDDYIQTGAKPVDTADATYVFWIKCSETGDNRVVFGHGAASIGGFTVNHSTGGKPLLYLKGDLYQYWVDIPQQDDGQWHHWAVVVDVDDMTACKLYVDGVEQTQNLRDTAGTVTSYGDLRIARGDSEYWAGSMSEFAVYDVMLSASQVKTLYNGREPYNHKEGIASGNLKAWYRMGDGLENNSGTTIYDMSNNSNNGTMTNMAADDFVGDTP